MNILILSSEAALDLISKQTGQHRLGPVPLTDGRYFLSADVLTDNHFAQQLESVEYQISSLEQIKDLLLNTEELFDEL